jgi:hypothetical protein
MLRRHLLRQRERLLAFGGDADTGHLFQRPEGGPWHPNPISDGFERRVKKTTLPVIRFHDLRHSHAIAALAAGQQLKTVSLRLGHETQAVTADIYAGHYVEHLDDDVSGGDSHPARSVMRTTPTRCVPERNAPSYRDADRSTRILDTRPRRKATMTTDEIQEHARLVLQTDGGLIEPGKLSLLDQTAAQMRDDDVDGFAMFADAVEAMERARSHEDELLVADVAALLVCGGPEVVDA